MGEPGVSGLEAARLHLRSAGYCVGCDRIVVRTDDGGCPAGHPAEAISGKILLGLDEPVPRLPAFNLAAFSLPPVWGIAHGQLAGLFFLPIWLFADSAISQAGRNLVTSLAAAVVLLGTIAFQVYFAKRANGVAWRRVSDDVTVEQFVGRQRVWALACVPIGLVLLAWALYYRLVLA